ncbi:sugar phosphate isomerase/epimerase [Candidatus Bipolaricaulota bacterium]|nr:sugar phosphate isomerase/epimerase [Candidatus Bipolaricaulota bacterium]
MVQMTKRWPLGMIVPVQDPTPFSPFPPGQWRKALREVAKAGYSAVELAVTDPTKVDHEEMAEALREAGLRLSSLTTGQAAAKEGLSLSTREDTVRKRAIRRIQDHMRLARPHGAVVIVGLLRGADGSPDLLADSLRECARFDPSVKLALEPLNRYESRLINTVGEALEVVERVGAENLGVLFDTFHANIEERSLSEAILLAKDRLFHVHLADSNRWVPGYGHLRFRKITTALEEVGYRGALVVEALPRPSPTVLLSFPGQAGVLFA